MAQPQLTHIPYSVSENENFREFQFLLRSNLAVAALPANQQASFLQLHLRDTALRFFQTLPLAIRHNRELSLTALRDRFCNPQLEELHFLKLENIKLVSKADTRIFWSRYKHEERKHIRMQIRRQLHQFLHMP